VGEPTATVRRRRKILERVKAMKSERTRPLYSRSCSKVPLRISCDALTLWKTNTPSGDAVRGWSLASHGLIMPSHPMAQ